MLSVAGAQGMELAQIARSIVDPGGSLRIDLLKLKAYLTCFPSRIVVAPKMKSYPDGLTKRVDQVWLISSE